MGKVKILLVSSNDADCKQFRSMLTESEIDHELTIALNYMRGIDSLKNNIFDICFIDNDLKVVSGIELIKKLKREEFMEPLVLLLGESEAEVGENSLMAGASDYLVKDELNSVILKKVIRYALSITDLVKRQRASERAGANLESLKLVADASIELASFNYLESAAKVSKLIVSRVAEWCVIELVNDNGLEMIAAEHTVPYNISYIKELRERFPPGLKDSFGPGNVIKTKRHEYLPEIDELKMKELAKNNKQLELLKKLGFGSYLSIPIIFGKKLIGIITVASAIPGRFGEEELTGLTEIAAHLAITLENSRLYYQSKQSENIFKRLAESNIVGIAIFNTEGRVLAANNNLLDLLGYKKEEVTSPAFKWMSIYPPEYIKHLKETGEELLRDGMTTPHEHEFMKRDGSRIPVLTGNVLLDKEKGTALSFVLDITQQKELERQKDEFISIASHELKTPLTSQRVFVDLLQKAIAKNEREKITEYTVKVSEQTEKLVKLVNDLLDVSRIQAGKIQLKLTEEDINGLVAKAVENVRAVSKGYEFIISGMIERPVLCDKYRIEQVLSNLLTNAVKYSPDNKKVVVKLVSSDKNAKICVQDFGIGISSENIRKLFGRFVRVPGVEKQFPGFGLGLYIVSEIIKRHNGEIEVESVLGTGSTFCFTLPLAERGTINPDYIT